MAGSSSGPTRSMMASAMVSPLANSAASDCSTPTRHTLRLALWSIERGNEFLPARQVPGRKVLHVLVVLHIRRRFGLGDRFFLRLLLVDGLLRNLFLLHAGAPWTRPATASGALGRFLRGG